MKVTPYKVEGEVNYNKVVKEFGATLIDSKLKSKLKGVRLVDKEIFFAHRDLDKIVKSESVHFKFHLEKAQDGDAVSQILISK